MRISILIPCHNEEKSIQKCVESCLNQSQKADEVVVVNDGSTDRSGEILAAFGDAIKVVSIPIATGNKSHAQERGLKYITGDIFIATDGDTVLHEDFIKNISKHFIDARVVAVCGYVKSIAHNWLTRSRAFEYCISQNIHKLAQSYMRFVFVIPGAAGAFRTDIFRSHLTFDHDTITEDLDFTYKLNKSQMLIGYCRKAIVYTQDPATLHGYINQVRRWYGGGWQNLLKHWDIVLRPVQALEMSLIYIEGFVFSIVLFLLPFINLQLAIKFNMLYVIMSMALALYASIKEQRKDLLFAPVASVFLTYINSYIFLEQMIKEIVLRRKNLHWFKPERVEL